MVHCGPQRVSMLAVGCPSLMLGRLFMCYDFATWRSKSSFVGRDNVLRRITVDAAWICAVSSMPFMRVAKDGLLSVMVHQGPLKLILRKNVP
jgi:hypothetical protein